MVSASRAPSAVRVQRRPFCSTKPLAMSACAARLTDGREASSAFASDVRFVAGALSRWSRMRRRRMALTLRGTHHPKNVTISKNVTLLCGEVATLLQSANLLCRRDGSMISMPGSRRRAQQKPAGGTANECTGIALLGSHCGGQVYAPSVAPAPTALCHAVEHCIRRGACVAVPWPTAARPPPGSARTLGSPGPPAAVRAATPRTDPLAPVPRPARIDHGAILAPRQVSAQSRTGGIPWSAVGIIG